MTVLFYGNVIDQAGGAQSVQVQDAASVRALIDALGNRFGQDFKAFLLGDETCLLLVNGKGIMATGGLDTQLEDGDKIEIVPFVVAG
ncbi:MAG: MoaD/ThiS family protein [Oscillospiraceae bacterium]|nr:MoaD/ThiS family protein [Oscillospiraceae bacterium]